MQITRWVKASAARGSRVFRARFVTRCVTPRACRRDNGELPSARRIVSASRRVCRVIALEKLRDAKTLPAPHCNFPRPARQLSGTRQLSATNTAIVRDHLPGRPGHGNPPPPTPQCSTISIRPHDMAAGEPPSNRIAVADGRAASATPGTWPADPSSPLSSVPTRSASEASG